MSMEQKYLKKGGLIAFIALLSMTPPLATDLYMPSLPEMTNYYQTTSSVTSYTMTIFFIFMAIGILILGPMSDKYGRKPVLLGSILVALTFSIICAISPSIWILIAARAIQAFGAGGMVAISTALIKDSFEGKEMSNVLSITQAIVLLAPMLAPILGAVILAFFSWKMTFVALAVLFLVSLIGGFLLEETLPQEKRVSGSTFKSILGLTSIVKDKKFTSLLLVVALLMAPFMAYLTLASYIYIDGFGISESAFSLYFAGAACIGLIGPFLYMRVGGGSIKKSINIAFVIVTISICLLFLVGSISPFVFLVCYVPFTVITTYLRPMVSNTLLSMQKSNVGAASSLMNFGFTVIGSVGMMVGSLQWGDYINGLSMTMLIFLVLSLLLWIYCLQKKIITD
ncbi:hypothetical protein A8L44_16490 [Bacillus sp. FJAT-27986]|nr:hypothetical protein A8L44_16490 [Bacillus sp. FJAT-27986]